MDLLLAAWSLKASATSMTLPSTNLLCDALHRASPDPEGPSDQRHTPFAERNVMESLHDLRPRFHPCGLMLAARITLPHFSVSSAISLPKSAGEPGSTVPPRLASRAWNLGSEMLALISVLSLSTISAGVLFGAPMPYQLLTS